MAACHLCNSEGVETLIEFGSHPIAHGFLDSTEQEEYEHPVTLGFCHGCGLTQIIDPISPELLNTEFQVSAWKFNPHAERMLDSIEALPGIDNASPVLEVGSNDGTFLSQLRERGFSTLLGMEPAAHAVAAARERGIETRAEFFDPRVAREVVDSFGRCKLLLARQVLEHVHGLQDFAEAMRIVLAPGAWVVVEVPDFGFNQEATDYSAIWEEHVNHFTAETMTRLLAEAGVTVEKVDSEVFSGKALIVVGRAAGDGADVATKPKDLDLLRERAYSYRDRWPGFRTAMNDYLAGESEHGRKIGVYGAGCRTSALVNYCDLGQYLECVLDDQAEKQGKLMPGSLLPIVSGDALDDGEIDLALLAVNAENEDKVIARRRAFLDRGGEFVSVHPPSERLPAFWKQQ